MPTFSSLLVVLPLLLAQDDAKRPVGGPETGIESAVFSPRFYRGGLFDRLTGMRCCRDGDRSWLLFSSEIPDWHAGSLLPFYLAASVLGDPVTTDATWVVEIDRKGGMVGAPKRLLPPIYPPERLNHLGGECLGCCYHDGKIICLSLEGTIFEIPADADKGKSTVICREVGALSARKLAAEFCDDAQRAGFHALRVNSTGDPEIYLEIERKNGQRMFVRRTFKWDDLDLPNDGKVPAYFDAPFRDDAQHAQARYLPNDARPSTYFYLGEVTDEQRLSAVYDRETDDLLLVKPEAFEVVRRMPLMGKERHDDLKKGIERYLDEVRRMIEAFKPLDEKWNLPREMQEPDYVPPVAPYGKLRLEDRINLGLSGLFKGVEVGDRAYCLYMDMGEGKLCAQPYDKGKLGEAVGSPSPGRIIDYKTVAAGKRLIAFTVEAEFREHKLANGEKVNVAERYCFRSYRFDGAAWKQLSDWRDGLAEESRPVIVPSLSDLIPVYQPVAIGDDVFVYYTAKWHKSEVPKVDHLKLNDSE